MSSVDIASSSSLPYSATIFSARPFCISTRFGSDRSLNKVSLTGSWSEKGHKEKPFVIVALIRAAGVNQASFANKHKEKQKKKKEARKSFSQVSFCSVARTQWQPPQQ